MRVRIMGPAVEVAQALEALRGCRRLDVATVSDLLPNRGSRSGPRWVRAYIDATVRPQTAPCHGEAAAEWVGETAGPDGPVHAWSCRECGGTWTAPASTPEVNR